MRDRDGNSGGRGDGTDPEVPAQAAPKRADVFAALTADTDSNRVLCGWAGSLEDDLRTVARVDRAEETVAGPTRTGGDHNYKRSDGSQGVCL